MNLPVQLDTCATMEMLTRQGNDLYSFLDVSGCYSKFYFALKLAESSYRTLPAKQKNENGDVS